MLLVSDYRPSLTLEFVKPRGKEELPTLLVDVADFISIKGIKALGNQLATQKIKQIHLHEPLPFTIEEEVEEKMQSVENKDSTDTNNGSLLLF